MSLAYYCPLLSPLLYKVMFLCCPQFLLPFYSFKKKKRLNEKRKKDHYHSLDHDPYLLNQELDF